MPNELQNQIDILKREVEDHDEAIKTALQTRQALAMLLDGLNVYFDDCRWVNHAESEKAAVTKEIMGTIRAAWKRL